MLVAKTTVFSVLFTSLVVASCSEVHEKDLAPGSEEDATDANVLNPDGAGPLVDAAPTQDAFVGMDAGPAPDAAFDAQADAEVLIDVCDNPDDLAGLTELGGQFNQILQEQGIPCFIASMGGPRFAMCIAGALSEYLSEDCALCVGQQADCLVSNCLDRCITDQGGDACIECVCNAGCVQDFATCSGVDFGLFECPEP